MAKGSATPARGKKPRASAKGKAKLSPDLFIPRRKVGAALKIVPLHDGSEQGELLFQRALKDPSELTRAFQNRPPWVDDVAAITLVAFGLISLLALLNTTAVTSTAISDQWADLLSQIFGRTGAMVLCFLVVGAGAVIALARFGTVIHLPWQRVLGIEIAYLAMLAMLHLAANDPEPRALARSGQGGGFIGWALGEIMALLFGRLLSLFIYALIFTLALVMIFALRRKHFRAALKFASAGLDRTAERIRLYMSGVATARQNWQAARAQAQPMVRAPLSAPALESGPLAESYGSEQAVVAAGPLPGEATVPVQVITPARAGASPIITVPPRRETPRPAATAGPAPAGPTSIGPASIGPVKATPAPTPVVNETQNASPPQPVPVRPAAGSVPIRPAASRPAEPTPAPLAPTDSESELEAVETFRPPLPSSPVPIGMSRPSASVPVAQALPPRTPRHFTVEDFADTRREIPREGLPPLTLLSDTRAQQADRG